MEPSSEVLATIPVGFEPRWVVIAADGRRAYVTGRDHPDAPIPAVLAVIDTGANELVASVAVGGGEPSGVVLSPDGRVAYMPNFFNGEGVVSVIDTRTTAVVDTIIVSGLGGGTTGVAIKPDGSRVYVPTSQELDQPEGQGKVSVIDTATRRVVATIVSHPNPANAFMGPDGRFVYVLDHDGAPAVIDTQTHEKTLALGMLSGERIAFTPDGKLGYVVDDDEHVAVIDIATGELVNLLTSGGGRATDVAITPDGRLVYVALRTVDQIAVLETGTTKMPTHPVSWSGTGNGIAIMPDGATGYASDARSRAVHVIPVG